MLVVSGDRKRVHIFEGWSVIYIDFGSKLDQNLYCANFSPFHGVVERRLTFIRSIVDLRAGRNKFFDNMNVIARGGATEGAAISIEPITI